MSPTLMLKVCNYLRLARRHFQVTKSTAPEGLEQAYNAALRMLYLLEESEGATVDLRLLLNVLRRHIDQSSLKIDARLHRSYRNLDIHPDSLAREALRSAASALGYIRGH